MNICIYIYQPTRLAQHVLCRCDQHFGGYLLGYWWKHMVSEGKLRFKRFREICWQAGDTLSDLCLHAFSIPKRKFDQTCCQFRKESRKQRRKGCWIGTGKLPCSIGENCVRWWTMQFWLVIGVRPWQHGHDPREGPLSATEHGRVEEAPKHWPGIPYAIYCCSRWLNPS